MSDTGQEIIPAGSRDAITHGSYHRLVLVELLFWAFDDLRSMPGTAIRQSNVARQIATMQQKCRDDANTPDVSNASIEEAIIALMRIYFHAHEQIFVRHRGHLSNRDILHGVTHRLGVLMWRLAQVAMLRGEMHKFDAINAYDKIEGEWNVQEPFVINPKMHRADEEGERYPVFDAQGYMVRREADVDLTEYRVPNIYAAPLDQRMAFNLPYTGQETMMTSYLMYITAHTVKEDEYKTIDPIHIVALYAHAAALTLDAVSYRQSFLHVTEDPMSESKFAYVYALVLYVCRRFHMHDSYHVAYAYEFFAPGSEHARAEPGSRDQIARMFLRHFMQSMILDTHFTALLVHPERMPLFGVLVAVFNAFLGPLKEPLGLGPEKEQVNQ